MVEIRAGGDRNGVLVANKAETFGQGLSRRHCRAADEHRNYLGARGCGQLYFQADEIVFLLDAVRAASVGPCQAAPITAMTTRQRCMADSIWAGNCAATGMLETSRKTAFFP